MGLHEDRILVSNPEPVVSNDENVDLPGFIKIRPKPSKVKLETGSDKEEEKIPTLGRKIKAKKKIKHKKENHTKTHLDNAELDGFMNENKDFECSECQKVNGTG